MANHLLTGFLESEGQYGQAQEFWRKMVDDEARHVGQAGEWVSWRPQTFADGVTAQPRDGNPIYDARSERLSRALQVIQSPPESDDVELALWFGTFDYSESGGPGPTIELTLNLSLSEESAAIARQLVGMWMDPRVTREDVEQRLRILVSRE